MGPPFKEGTASFGQYWCRFFAKITWVIAGSLPSMRTFSYFICHRISKMSSTSSMFPSRNHGLSISESTFSHVDYLIYIPVDCWGVELNAHNFSTQQLFYWLHNTNSTMPRGKTNYITVLSFPEVTVPYQQPSGQMVLYSIWNEVGTRKEFIKCDLCGQLLPLTNTRLPTWLHQQCQKQAANLKNSQGNFINTFRRFRA